MKRKTILLLVAVLLALPSVMVAQKTIRVTRFERDYTGLEARMNPVYDNSGEACALVNVWVPDKEFVIEANLGVVKKDVLFDHIKLWIPKGTKRITVRREGCMPLKGFVFPITIEAKVTYDAYIELTAEKPKTAPQSNVYIGAGYQVMQVMGPSVAVGVNVNHHNIELGGVYGIDKTDDLYFYNSSGDLLSGHNYSALRAHLSYGYELPLASFFSITPQVGGVYHAYIGKDAEQASNSSNYESANSISAMGALRLTLSFSKNLKMSITPEYDMAMWKDETCKLLSKHEDKIKSWNTGFNLNIGLMVFF